MALLLVRRRPSWHNKLSSTCLQHHYPRLKAVVDGQHRLVLSSAQSTGANLPSITDVASNVLEHPVTGDQGKCNHGFALAIWASSSHPVLLCHLAPPTPHLDPLALW